MGRTSESSALFDTPKNWSNRERLDDRVVDVRAYYWFFGLIHSKVFLTFVMFLLAGLSLQMFLHTATRPYIHLSIPGVDAKSLLGDETLGKSKQNKLNGVDKMFDRTVTTTPPTVAEPGQEANSKWCRDLLNIWSYFCIISVALAAIGLRVSEIEKNARKYRGCRVIFNPALLIVPLFITILSFAYPLCVWSLRAYHSGTFDCRDPRNNSVECSTVFFWLDFARLIAFPVFLVWVSFGYVIYGCSLAFAYTWNRANMKIKKNAVVPTRFYQDRRPFLRDSVSRRSNRWKDTYGASFSKRSLREAKHRPTLTSTFREKNEPQSSLLLPSIFEKVDIEAGNNNVSGRDNYIKTVMEKDET